MTKSAKWQVSLLLFINIMSETSWRTVIIIIIKIIIIIIYSLGFFTSALADGLSLEFEWQQVSSSLYDSSQYSGCSQ